MEGKACTFSFRPRGITEARGNRRCKHLDVLLVDTVEGLLASIVPARLICGDLWTDQVLGNVQLQAIDLYWHALNVVSLQHELVSL
jgi:hypothetical protein